MALWVQEWKPTIAMLFYVIICAVLTALSKKALEEGMEPMVFVTFRQLTATVFLGPIAYFKERKKRPQMTTEAFMWLFISAILGAAVPQYAFFFGLRNTTGTFAITFSNMSPSVTFLIAVMLRLESLKIVSIAGAAKIAGALTSLSGALTLTLYKGMPLTENIGQAVPPSSSSRVVASHRWNDWTLGTIALVASCLCSSSWLLLQARFADKYPAMFTSAAVMFFFSTIQAGALSFASQRSNYSVWVLKDKWEITAVLYAGIMASGVGYLLMTFCIEKRGPVYTAAFFPLIQIMVAAIDFFVVHEELYLGSMIGAILVMIGLYVLLWGKNREQHAPSSLLSPVKVAQDGDEQTAESKV